MPTAAPGLTSRLTIVAAFVSIGKTVVRTTLADVHIIRKSAMGQGIPIAMTSHSHDSIRHSPPRGKQESGDMHKLMLAVAICLSVFFSGDAFAQKALTNDGVIQ